MTLSSGARLGPYEIVAPLGAGGMGEVYRARDSRLGRTVAIKVLPESVASDSRRLHRFEQEARAASALNHPNILTVHDFDSSEEATYLVTELLEGESLRAIVHRGPVPLDRVVDIATQIARGLAASHAAGIVHRDLKPENLFVTRDGIAKILDFGLARVTQSTTDEVRASQTPTLVKTQEGTVLGTVGYMAPEQVRGEMVDARADIFSFGCVLYEMLTGRLAFGGESRSRTLAAILEDEPADPSTFGCEVPTPLRHILRHCLEKDPARRFQSAGDLLFALEEAAASMSIPVPARPATPARRVRRLPLLAGIAFVAVIALLVVFALRKAPAPSQPSPMTPESGTNTIDSLAVLPLTNLSGDPKQDYFSDGMTEALIAELAKLKALKVISRTSVMRFKGTTKPLPEIARELGVHGVIEGSVLPDGDQVRITVQLIDGPEDRHLWAESYTRPARDILRLQGEVARAIAHQVNIVVSPEEERALTTARAVDPEAHRLLLEAMEMNRHGASQLADTRRMAELVDRALEIAPDYALAHVFRASNLWAMSGNGYESGITACPRARRELNVALGLEPELLEARIWDAALKWRCDGDINGAEREYLDLLDRAPGNATVHDAYAFLLSEDGRNDEALEHSRRAFELDPLNEWIGGHRVGFLRLAGKLTDSIAMARKVLAFAPDSIYVQWELGNSQLAAGDLDGALKTYLARDVKHPELNPKLGVVWARKGNRRKAQEILDYLLDKREKQYVPASMIAAIYANLGEPAKALDWLDTAWAERDNFLFDLVREPDLDPLHNEPRFTALLKKMHLKESA